ncbi:MAG: phytanoyl-CoA dioxygenase family protein [Elusimicrobia bacterium]|nr:phytanoyl-CoA dioxygenase family protein [Elusimicrobiota bacterium]MDE2510213.1 phytanoyl-CoA dioxygenase family protein [Elusimicrobiota bacterium]
MSVTTIRFTKRDAKSPSAAALSKVRSGMKRDGVVAFKNLFPLPLLRRARREVLRRHESGQLRARGLVRDIAGRYAAVLPFVGPFLDRSFYANPAVIAIISSLLGDDHCIGSLETVISMPLSGRQHQHIDGPIRFDRTVAGMKRRYAGDLSDLPPYAVTLCVPLCDVDEGNGPTAVWAGSHRAALRARPPGQAAISRRYPEVHMAGEFGSSFLFDFRTFHGGLENVSREPRPLLMFVFTRTWYRDPNMAEVFPSVVISKRNLRRVPERDRRLFMLAPDARRRIWR